MNSEYVNIDHDGFNPIFSITVDILIIIGRMTLQNLTI